MNTRPLNDTLLRTLDGEITPVTPIWMMRQAGRYLPEYMEIRKDIGTFMGMCTRPDVAAEVTLQPLKRFPIDAVIIFSDILTIPDAMGLGLHFVEGKGPQFKTPLRHEREIKKLEVPAMEKLSYVFDALRETKKRLQGQVPLIGFCGSPFTLACYMIEGAGSKTFQKTKEMMYSSPELMHHILETTAKALIPYLTEQAKAGADVLQIFDTWGGILSTPAFEAFSLHYTEMVLRGVREALGEEACPPFICFTKDATLGWYKRYKKAGATAVGVDWRYELSEVAEVLPGFPLQGNMDPFLLQGTDEAIIERIHQIIDQIPHDTPHIFNLGHGMDKATHPDKVKLLVEEVHRYSKIVLSKN